MIEKCLLVEYVVLAATAAVLSTTTFADDDEITMDVDTAGTGASIIVDTFVVNVVD